MPPALLNRTARTKFRAVLLRWFDRQRRVLPWRANHDPYRVWVSEIMLQQTRVAAVLEHYASFLERFPSVQALAKARSASVLTVWSGLGYYRRARLLHAAARQIVHERAGEFPRTAAEWRELPGIGRYTAAAIASICFGEQCAVVDGNVQRVLDRMLASCSPHHRDDTWTWAGELLSPQRPGDFNQAMMELGALVCTPRVPQCSLCPVAKWCAGRFDAPSAKMAMRTSRNKSRLAYALVTCAGQVRLAQRSERETVMPGMWELPLIPVSGLPSPASHSETFTLRHAIMNTDYEVTVARTPFNGNCPGKWFPVHRLGKLPLTGLARKILNRAKMI
jgi:A/G-specific adenine glycosylase